MPSTIIYVVLAVLGASILIYYRRIQIFQSPAPTELSSSLGPTSFTSSHAARTSINDTSKQVKIKSHELNAESAKMHRTHALIQKYILSGSLVLNTSDDVYDKLFYDGNLYPMHQHQHSQSISSRCSEHALGAPVLPAISTRVFNFS